MEKEKEKAELDIKSGSPLKVEGNKQRSKAHSNPESSKNKPSTVEDEEESKEDENPASLKKDGDT